MRSHNHSICSRKLSSLPCVCLTDLCHSPLRCGRVLDHVAPPVCSLLSFVLNPLFLQVVPTQSLQVIAVACASLASKQYEVKTSYLSYLVKTCSPPNSTFIPVQLHAQPPSSWVEISLNAFSVTVLVHIEW
jgi:hypothetical protein